ncbi:uncharacterized protein LOC119725478 [Patiria miniata]|uniref:Uncharacterized protein n=1 Tax=Patiria miniata TaxID=46514 RepID=A0A913ZN72_PATMI|nr:uncharacterized protein LOC119725478 [Patiria miniata]
MGELVSLLNILLTDKVSIDDEYLNHLSSKIESSWKELAKHLGFEEVEIADIQTTNEGSTVESRHMLLTWWEKTTDRDEAAQTLRRALEAIGLTDLAQNVLVTSKSRDEAAGPEPERRQDAGVDKESKQNGAASTKEEKLKKEHVCDQDKPRIICFRHVQVFIRSHIRHKPTTLCLQIDPESSVLALKQIIQEKISVQPEQQRLFIQRNLRNFELCNLLTLHDCEIHQDENISLRLCTIMAYWAVDQKTNALVMINSSGTWLRKFNHPGKNWQNRLDLQKQKSGKSKPPSRETKKGA